jgi:hypothetical protein
MKALNKQIALPLPNAGQIFVIRCSLSASGVKQPSNPQPQLFTKT